MSNTKKKKKKREAVTVTIRHLLISILCLWVCQNDVKSTHCAMVDTPPETHKAAITTSDRRPYNF